MSVKAYVNPCRFFRLHKALRLRLLLHTGRHFWTAVLSKMPEEDIHAVGLCWLYADRHGLQDEVMSHCSSLSSDVAAASFSVPLRINPVYKQGQNSRQWAAQAYVTGKQGLHCSQVQQMARGTSTLSCGRELLEITEQLIRDMPAELPGTVREGATALQLLKGAKNEEVHSLA